MMRTLIINLFVCLISSSTLCLAHPLGNFSLNHLNILELSDAGLLSQHLLDYAEIPSYNELANIDSDNDNLISEGD